MKLNGLVAYFICFCITWCMVKINYICNEKQINHTLPKRKWYENKKKGRVQNIYLSSVEKWTRGYVPDILLTVKDDTIKKIQHNLRMDEEIELLLATFSDFPVSIAKFQEMIIFDGNRTELFSQVLPEISSNLNKLSVITKSPYSYQTVFDGLYEDTGLVATCENSYISDKRIYGDLEEEKPFYKRQKYNEERTMIISAKSDKKLPIRSFHTGSHFFDISFDNIYEREITQKRPDLTYYSMAKFLDTIAKNRYNTLVKEGNVNQNIIKDNNKKFGIIRKGK